MEADKLKKIAVVVVHGVGDQLPSESANKVGDLLQSLNVGQTGPAQREVPKYTPFTEQKLHIDVRPVIVAPHDEQEWDKHKKEIQGPFNAWVQSKLDHPPAKVTPPSAELTNPLVQASDRTLDDAIWFQFTRGQLRSYKGEEPENTYETVRLVGQRNPQGGQPEREVHLYELYWADLSRLKAGVFSVFTELYQLLFHLASLGGHAINAASLHHKTASWRTLRWFQNSSSFVLAVPLPVINLLMLAVAGIAIVLAELRQARTVAQAAITVAVAGGIVLSLIGLLLWRGMNLRYTTAEEWAARINRKFPPYRWIVPGFGWIAVIAATVYFVYRATNGEQPVAGAYGWPWLQWMESVLLAGLFGSVVFVLLRAYDKRRPGALKWAGGLTAVLLTVGLLSFLYRPLPEALNNPVAFWVREFETLYGGLFLFWALFFGFAFGTLVCGYLAVLNISDATQKDLARRSRWTGSLLLALPTFAFVTVTLAAWGLIYYLVSKWIPTVAYSPFLPLRGTPSVNDALTLSRHIIGGPATRVLPVIFFMAAVAIVPAIWGLAPVVWREVFPPSSKDPGHSRSTRLGRWLTLAFRALLVAGVLLVTAMLLVFPALALAYLISPGKFEGLQNLWFGWLSGTAFALFLLVRGRLKNLAAGFRPLLDVLLDVDNWLREHPLDSNPKARILGRYVSLLRYICAQGYDGVVIIAHSQGTVITADLLRFLKFEAQASNLDFKTYDPDLALLDERNLYLFTMGCPLRQLYALRFPHLYHWARHDDEDLMPKWGKGDIPPSRHPDPKDLAGLNLWENAYRSGDYVGRHLWRTEPCAYIWTGDQAGSPVSGPKPFNSTDGVIRVEFCIGAGAHTHYWDKTAQVIGEELDRLIESV